MRRVDGGVRTATTTAVLAVLAAVAACSSSQPATPTSPPASAPPVATHPASPQPPATAAKTVDGNITIASAGSMPPGPMKITPLYCGKFTAAQQNRYGTTATGGLIYRYANESNTLQASVSVSVNFTDGATVTGNNVTGSDSPAIGPGQNASGEVDAVGGGGQNLSFRGCEIMSYSLVTNSGAQPVSYAG